MRIDPRLVLAIVLSLLANVSIADEGIVIVRDLPFYDRAGFDAFEAGTLELGSKVVAVGDGPPGWLAIEPPRSAFDWIDEAAIRPSHEPNAARVVANSATVRSARRQAKLPGPPKRTLRRGDMVELVDVGPLRVRFGTERVVWRAIAPAADELFYVRIEGIELIGKRFRNRSRLKRTKTASTIESDSSETARVDESLARLGPRASNAALPDAIEAEIRSAEDEHRAMLREPIEQWNTGSIAHRYRRILARNNLPAAAATIVRARLEELKRQEEAATAATELDDRLRRGRRRTGGSVAKKFGPNAAKPKMKRPFDAVGLLQPSAKLHDGEKVFALIARDGLISTYLAIPPGYDTRPLIAHRVGVRGEKRFDESIGGNLILVNELEWLEDED